MLLEELKQRNIDIAVISDTRIGETDVNLLRQNDDYHCIYTEKPNTIVPCRGVLILWKKQSLITIDRISDRDDGNLLLARATFSNHTILICGLYGPNEDAPEFFEYIENLLIQNTECNIILCGDFNVTQNHSIDNENYAGEHNRRARVKLQDIMERQELVDIYREIHGDIKCYTYQEMYSTII